MQGVRKTLLPRAEPPGRLCSRGKKSGPDGTADGGVHRSMTAQPNRGAAMCCLALAELQHSTRDSSELCALKLDDLKKTSSVLSASSAHTWYEEKHCRTARPVHPSCTEHHPPTRGVSHGPLAPWRESGPPITLRFRCTLSTPLGMGWRGDFQTISPCQITYTTRII